MEVISSFGRNSLDNILGIAKIANALESSGPVKMKTAGVINDGEVMAGEVEGGGGEGEGERQGSFPRGRGGEGGRYR